jgi:hypothetical protein
LQFSERGALLRKLQNIGSCGAMLRAPVKLCHYRDSIQLAQTTAVWFIMKADAHMVELADTLL